MNDQYEIRVGGDVTGQVAVGQSVDLVQQRAGIDSSREKLVVLFLAANPLDTERLRLDEEVRDIDRRLRESEHRDRLELRQQWAVRPTDLAEALLRHRPGVVHFSGHGSPSGRIVLVGDHGDSYEPPASAVADLFAIAGSSVRCVVLNACHSASLADAIAEHVDCVVGTVRAIEDEAAVRFAAGFYRGIGYGESVATAFALGRNEIQLTAAGDPSTPVLVAGRGVPPDQLRLVEDRT
jgi:hypothetical protein